MMNWKDFIGASGDDPAAESLRRLTADIRHAERVAAARLAAEAALIAADLEERPGANRSTTVPLNGTAIMAAGVTLLAATELLGAGGPRGIGGEQRATARMPWAQALGSGRAQARDGLAWNAAIQVLASERPEAPAQWVWSEGMICILLPGGWLGRHLVPPLWTRAIAGRKAREYYRAENVSAALRWAAHYQAAEQALWHG